MRRALRLQRGEQPVLGVWGRGPGVLRGRSLHRRGDLQQQRLPVSRWAANGGPAVADPGAGMHRSRLSLTAERSDVSRILGIAAHAQGETMDGPALEELADRFLRPR